MNLEKRVQNLEQELQILKNQIQATLLTIQEQLLTNAYPSLRANDVSSDSDEVHPPHSPSPPRQEPVYGNTDQTGPNSIRQVSLNRPKGNSAATSAVIDDDDPPEADAPTPVVRKVSLEEVDPMPSHRQQSFATSMHQQPPRPVEHHNGRHRNPQPEVMYENDDNFNPDEFVYDGTSSAPFIVETDWETLANLEEWAANKVDAIGVTRTQKLIHVYGQQGRFTHQIMSALLQFVLLYEEERTDGLPSADKHDDLPGYFDDDDINDDSDLYDYEDEEVNPVQNRKTVLRLIAGIQNAGAGIRGKRRNG